MAFQSAIRFPEVFVLERIHGEEPLYVYTLDMSDVLTPSEAAAAVLQTEYQFERDELRNKLVEFNIGDDSIDEIFSIMEAQNRTIKLLELVRILKKNGISISNTVTFLKSLSIDDQLITRIISTAGGA
jgi:hypothetical protein